VISSVIVVVYWCRLLFFLVRTAINYVRLHSVCFAFRNLPLRLLIGHQNGHLTYRNTASATSGVTLVWKVRGTRQIFWLGVLIKWGVRSPTPKSGGPDPHPPKIRPMSATFVELLSDLCKTDVNQVVTLERWYVLLPIITQSRPFLSGRIRQHYLIFFLLLLCFFILRFSESMTDGGTFSLLPCFTLWRRMLLLCAWRMSMCLSSINRHACQLRWRHTRRRGGCHDDGSRRGLFRGRGVGRCVSGRSDMSPAPGALFRLADDENQRLRNVDVIDSGSASASAFFRLLRGCRRRVPARIPPAPAHCLRCLFQAATDAQIDWIFSVNAHETGLRRHRSNVTSGGGVFMGGDCVCPLEKFSIKLLAEKLSISYSKFMFSGETRVN